MPDENANSGALVPVRTSPRPWRLEYDGATNRLEIRAEDDSLVAAWPMFSPYSDPQPDARLIVESVNGRDPMFDLLKMRREETIRMKQEAAEAGAEILVLSDAFAEFKAAVRSMREWQRAYFRARSGETLNRAKAAEREVDALLARFDRLNEPKQEQLPLEGGTP